LTRLQCAQVLTDGAQRIAPAPHFTLESYPGVGDRALDRSLCLPLNLGRKSADLLVEESLRSFACPGELALIIFRRDLNLPDALGNLIQVTANRCSLLPQLKLSLILCLSIE